jgi:hypothetical protein
MEKLSAGMQASLAELQAGGTGISDGEACGNFDWIVDFPDFAHMVKSPQGLYHGVAPHTTRNAVAHAQDPDWPR